MKNSILKYFILLIILQTTSSVFAQIVNFPFDTDLNDSVNGYSATAVGNPTIINDDGNQVLQLKGDEYLSLPNALHESIDPNQNLEIQLRFKVTNTYTDAPFAGTGELGLRGRRILITNKGFSPYNLGFEIFVEEMDEEYRILISFGDDTNEGATFIFNEVIQENAWVDLKLILRINNARPSIVYKLNGYYNHFPLNYLDVDLFKPSLNTQRLWVGTDFENFQGDEGYAFAETSIDYIKIFNPTFVGNSNLVASALEMMTNHVNGTNPLSEAQQQTQLTTIVDNWDDDTYADISTDILNYMATYEEEEGTVYEFYTEYINPKEREVPLALQFMLMQYMVDNLYTDSNVDAMSGISFLDHEIMPGVVSESAPRISGIVEIDGDYNTNPGYYLNTSVFVVRPTGYYAAPGEIVDITVPSSLINQGVKVHVGAHYVDIREDYRGFQRFPTMTTKFGIENTSISVANPFGGAIYLVFEDGSNFGSVSVQFDNAVKSPYFSTKAGFSNSLADYQTDLSNAYVNWVDIESDNFMCTFPRAVAEISPDATEILTPLNAMVGKFNVIAGRPLDKIRSEYIIMEPQSYTQGTLPASYPMSIVNGDLTESDPEAFPASILNTDVYMRSYNGTTVFHELGHLHSFPTMYEEGETNVNIPTIIAFNTVYGVPLDTALYHVSGHQNLDGDQAALDWILDTKFRNNETATYEEMSYQHRGVAKYADVARLFSWDSLGLIHKYWYDAMLASGEIAEGIQYVSEDEYIQAASDQLGFNFAPLWHLWGSLPSEGLMNQLDSYARENRIRDRILYYRTLVPSNAAEFQETYSSIASNIEEHHRERYDAMLTYYDESVADSIYQRIDAILCRYYEVNCGSTAVEILEDNAITFSPNPTRGLLEINGMEGDCTIKVLTANGVVERAVKSSGILHSIDISDLPAGVHFIEIIDSQNVSVCFRKIVKL